MNAAITGWSIRTSLGSRVDDVVERLLAGDRAVADNDRFDARTFACRLAATIKAQPKASPHARIVPRMALFGLEVGHEAIAMAAAEPGDRMGLFFGMGGVRAHWDSLMPALAEGFRRLHPLWILRHLSNNAHALLAADIGARGEGVTYAGANAGAQALLGATLALHAGAVDVAVVVAYDSLVEPETIVEHAARGALPTSSAAELTAPYAVDPSPPVPGEAAAAVVLTRGSADALAQVASVTTLDPSEPADVVDGVAAGVIALDNAERLRLGHRHSADTPMLALAAALGNLGAATGVVQSILLSALLRRGALPPIAGLVHAAPGPLRPLHHAEPATATSALGCSAGAPDLTAAVRVSIDGARVRS